MIHYHGTPITPAEVFLTLAGNCFCVAHPRAQQIVACHQIGQSVMLDHGGFSKKTRGYEPNWPKYYAWSDRWLDFPTTWAIIPDVIDEGGQTQDALIADWPHGAERGAPVWHTDEPLARLLRLSENWPRVCIGSSGEHWEVLSDAWIARMDAAWNVLARRHRRTPNIHLLRGMQLGTWRWPFASVDSTDVAQNHNRAHNSARRMADRWDAANPRAPWTPRVDRQRELELSDA